MNFRGTLAGATLLAISLNTSSGNDEMLHVMLQGDSSDAMRALVLAEGGSITHDLPIINAVGASLSREQFELILNSDQVLRYIDDLAVSGEEEEEAQEHDCDVGGGLELQWQAGGFDWPLFNKREEPASLSRVELAWPAGLGKIQSIELDGRALQATLWEKQAAGTLDITLPKKPVLELNAKSELQVRFTSPSSPPPVQRDIDARLEFAGGCSTELVPGYPDNHENFYYAMVAGASDLHRFGVTGSGITIAVLDSGLWEHPALTTDTHGEPRIVARYDAIKNQSGTETFDASGHGTHMTSVIAHSGKVTSNGQPTGSFQGIAPDARLIPIRAFDVEGQGDMLDIVRGVQWVVEHREAYDIRVLNLSFAARPRWPYWLDPINQAVMRAWQAGIVVVAAAGNEGPEAMSIGSPGNLPYIITVGAVTDSWTLETRDDDYIPDFSSRGPTPEAHIKPDIVAPGGHITGITRPGSTLTMERPEYHLQTGEFVMTGSSQAAALVSGITALLLQMQPELTPDDIKCKLISSAEPAINADGLLAYSPFQQGHGYVSATRAVTLGDTGCGNLDMDIQADIRGEQHFQGPATVDNEGQVSLPGLNQLLSPSTPEKGLSLTRKWGVKEHLERTSAPSQTDPNHPFDWPRMYQEEKARIERLAEDKPSD